jgi:argininosuccinate lyase
MLGVISTMEPVEEKLRSQLVPEMLATDIAEYLVRKGVPFRETHHIAGRRWERH